MDGIYKTFVGRQRTKRDATQVADHLSDETAHELSEENLEVRNKQ